MERFPNGEDPYPFNLDHEMESFHFISNGEDPYPF